MTNSLLTTTLRDGPSVRRPTTRHTDGPLREYWRLLRKRCDLRFVAWKENSRYCQHSREAINEHLEGTFKLFTKRSGASRKRLIARSTQAALREHLLTTLDSDFRKLYCRSRWVSGPDNFCLIRIDIDAHHGERDVEDVVIWVCDTLGTGYRCESDRGASVYVWFRVPFGYCDWPRNKEGFRPLLSRYKVNKKIEELGVRLNLLRQQRGLEAKVEVQGSFLVTEGDYDDNGLPRSPSRVSASYSMGGSGLCKLPYASSLEDVAGLAGSVVTLAQLQAVLDRCPPAPAKIPITPNERPNGRGRHCPRSNRIVEILPSGNPWIDTKMCVSRAKASLRWQRGSETGPVFNLALRLYAENRCGSGDPEHDRKRLDRFMAAVQYMCSRGHDPKKAGGVRPSPPAGDVTTIECWLRRILPAEALASFNAPGPMINACGKQIQKRRTYVTYALLAYLAAATLSVRSETDGHLPMVRVRGRLKLWGRRDSGSAISAAMTVLSHLGVLRCIDRRYRFDRARPGEGRSRHFDVIALWEREASEQYLPDLACDRLVITGTPPAFSFPNHYWSVTGYHSPSDSDLAAICSELDEPDDPPWLFPVDDDDVFAEAE